MNQSDYFGKTLKPWPVFVDHYTWPWKTSRYIDNLAQIGVNKGNPWVQDSNHNVILWLPWKIGFVRGDNHSITAGILAGEGALVPNHVYDMSYLFDFINTDGANWYINGRKVEPVNSWRHAAYFEVGRLLANNNRSSI